MTRVRRLLIIMPLLIILSGCGVSPGAKNEYDDAVAEVLSTSVAPEDISKESQERGLKNAYRDASWGARFGYWWKGAFSSDKTKFDFFAEDHPSEVLDAQMDDHRKYGYTMEKKEDVVKRALPVAFRSYLINNINILLIMIFAVIVLILVVKCRMHAGIPTVGRKRLQELFHRAPHVEECQESTQAESSSPLSINYERGLRIYCSQHDEDYDELVQKYGGVKEAFEATLSK